MTILKATDPARALIQELAQEHGDISLHVSGSYGVSVVCLDAHELKLGARDVLVGTLEGAPLFLMTSEIDYWQGSTIILDVAPGVAAGFSLEGPRGVHFTLRKHADPGKRTWDANAILAAGAPRSNKDNEPMTDARPTLRSLLALPDTPAPLTKSALVLIDCQNTYREGIMHLDGVEPALQECQKLLKRARDAGTPVIHIRHDAGPGSPYDTNAPIGAIADSVAPQEGEKVITKAYPSSFEKTNLDAELKRLGVEDLVLAGFMTHVCVNSTARAAFNHGYRPTVIANATATRSLPNPTGGTLPADAVHNGALAALADIFAIVVPSGDKVPT